MTDSNYIIMADMVDSSKMPQPYTQNKFKVIVKDINNIFKKDILSPITITLGDEFQGIVNSSKTAIRLLIKLEEKLLFLGTPFKLRYVIYEGVVDTEINTEIAHGMVGEGLKNARHLLNLSKKGKMGDYIVMINIDKKNKFYNNCLKLFSMFIKDWQSKNQGELVEWLIEERDYKKVAIHYNKTPSAIWKRRKSLNIDAYIALKEVILTHE